MFKEVYALEKLHGCLKKGTKVLMADGKEKSIDTIKSGESVVVFDEKSSKFKTSTVEGVVVQESDPRLGWMEVMLENGKSVICTVDHPFLTERGWVPAEELKLTDNLISF